MYSWHGNRPVMEQKLYRTATRKCKLWGIPMACAGIAQHILSMSSKCYQWLLHGLPAPVLALRRGVNRIALHDIIIIKPAMTCTVINASRNSVPN